MARALRVCHLTASWEWEDGAPKPPAWRPVLTACGGYLQFGYVTRDPAMASCAHCLAAGFRSAVAGAVAIFDHSPELAAAEMAKARACDPWGREHQDAPGRPLADRWYLDWCRRALTRHPMLPTP